MEYSLDDLIGIPFSDGGRDKRGIDCLGLAIAAFKIFGIRFPDYTISALAAMEISRKIEDEIKNLRFEWQPIRRPEVPSLLIMKCHPIFVQHLAVYVGPDKFIHVGRKVDPSRIDRLSNPLWKKRIRGIFKHVR